MLISLCKALIKASIDGALATSTWIPLLAMQPQHNSIVLLISSLFLWPSLITVAEGRTNQHQRTWIVELFSIDLHATLPFLLFYSWSHPLTSGTLHHCLMNLATALYPEALSSYLTCSHPMPLVWCPLMAMSYDCSRNMMATWKNRRKLEFIRVIATVYALIFLQLTKVHPHRAYLFQSVHVVPSVRVYCWICNMQISAMSSSSMVRRL